MRMLPGELDFICAGTFLHARRERVWPSTKKALGAWRRSCVPEYAGLGRHLYMHREKTRSQLMWEASSRQEIDGVHLTKATAVESVFGGLKRTPM